MTIIRSEFIGEQIFAKSAFLGNAAPKYSNSAIGKWVILAEIDGMKVSGIGATIESAMVSAQAKRDLFY